MDVIALLRLAQSLGASDLHLSAEKPPVVRINGSLSSLDMELLEASDAEEAFSQLTTAQERDYFKKNLDIDFSYTVRDLCRVRCNAAMQRGTVSLALRLIPLQVPSFRELHLPDTCYNLIRKQRGLVVVSGPTGSGKTTTLAAMIECLNQNISRRIVTIEDPIEYVHTDKKCTIIQRQLGTDTHSFVDALKHALRHDPDIMLVGELRDMETAAAALNVAETGHLVLTTGHASSAPQTIERIIDLFPTHQQQFAQTRLASLISGILCQVLVPAINATGGRVPAVEILTANAAVRNLIRDGKLHQLPNVIRSNTQEGMQLLDHTLADLYNRKVISSESVLANCNDRGEVERLCGGITHTELSEKDFELQFSALTTGSGKDE